LDWNHLRSEELSVNDYENKRPLAKKVKKIQGQDRLNLLTFEWSASLDEILDACEETRNVRRQREDTMRQSRLQQRAEELKEYVKDNVPKLKDNIPRLFQKKRKSQTNESQQG
jgi:hypothetical protein